MFNSLHIEKNICLNNKLIDPLVAMSTAQLGNADIIQPGLIGLQPTIDDYMDTLEPLPSLQGKNKNDKSIIKFINKIVNKINKFFSRIKISFQLFPA